MTSTASAINVDHYTYRVSWSAEDDEYVATVLEHPLLSCLEDSPEKALAGLRELVASVTDDMVANGETPPEPFADRTYSGKFQLRIGPELHRSLVLAAAESGLSLNQYVIQRIQQAAARDALSRDALAQQVVARNARDAVLRFSAAWAAQSETFRERALTLRDAVEEDRAAVELAIAQIVGEDRAALDRLRDA